MTEDRRGPTGRTRRGRGSARRALMPVLALSVVVVGLAWAPLPAGGVAGFGDVEANAFYTEAVQWMVDESITSGVTAECFAPYRPITRGEAAVFMWRMEGQDPSAPSHGFADVPRWMDDAVAWMVDEGITFGTTATTFSPERSLERAEFASFLWRLEGRPGGSPPHPFTDVPSWLDEPVSWMARSGVTAGTTPTTFSPSATVTRGQVATFLHRYKGRPGVTVDPSHPRCSDDVASYHVVGDSVMVEIDARNGAGSTTAGCGYTGHLGTPAPCTIDLTPPEAPLVVATVSVWDVFASDLSSYTDAHDYYEGFGVPVVWIELPPYDVAPWSRALTDALNDAVAAELGCSLLPWSLRDAETTDGLHYTSAGVATVAGRFELLTATDAC